MNKSVTHGFSNMPAIINHQVFSIVIFSDKLN